MKVLFIDTDCPDACDARVLGRRALGGTESTLFHVTDGIARLPGVEVTIAQHNRRDEFTSAIGVRHIGYRHRSDLGEQPDAVVVLRNPKILPDLRRRFPEARILLWMHCFPGRRWRRRVTDIHRTDTTIIAVSDTLAERMRGLLRPALPPWEATARALTIYNPLSPAIAPSVSRHDPDKLVFFSSPHKGLDQVLEKFTAVRQRFPSMRLYVADPGYWNGPTHELPEGVVALGSLRPEEVHRHVSEALCVFYPQTRFAETFGLVFAEANLLGTPVIAHPLGAAREVLDAGGGGQVVDCSSTSAVVETIARWREGGRPQVGACPSFQLTEVVNRWRQLLEGSAKDRLAVPKQAA